MQRHCFSLHQDCSLYNEPQSCDAVYTRRSGRGSKVSGPATWFVIGKLRNTVILFRVSVFLFRIFFHFSLSCLLPRNQRSVCVIAMGLRPHFQKCSGAASDGWIICPPSQSQGMGSKLLPMSGIRLNRGALSMWRGPSHKGIVTQMRGFVRRMKLVSSEVSSRRAPSVLAQKKFIMKARMSHARGFDTRAVLLPHDGGRTTRLYFFTLRETGELICHCHFAISPTETAGILLLLALYASIP